MSSNTLDSSTSKPPSKRVRSKAKSRNKATLDALVPKFVAWLQGQRQLGGDAYPAKLGEIVEQVRESITGADSINIKSLSENKEFRRSVIVAAKQQGKSSHSLDDLPVCLVEDAEILAAAPALLDFAFASKDKTTRRFYTAAMLRDALTTSGNIAKAFFRRLSEQVSSGSLPYRYGAIAGASSNVTYILRLADIRTQATYAAPSSGGVPIRDVFEPSKGLQDHPSSCQNNLSLGFATDFSAAFDRLDRNQGRSGRIKLSALRRALPAYGRTDFDRCLKQLVVSGEFGWEAHDGNRTVISPEDQEAGIPDGSSQMIYATRFGS